MPRLLPLLSLEPSSIVRHSYSMFVLKVKDHKYKELAAAGIKAFDGVRDLVSQAYQQGWTVGLGSSGSPEKIRHNLSASGLEGKKFRCTTT